jgi:hypothetical protein
MPHPHIAQIIYRTRTSHKKYGRKSHIAHRTFLKENISYFGVKNKIFFKTH